MEEIKHLELQVKHLQERIKKLKEHKYDENLIYLNMNSYSNISENNWMLQLDDQNDIEYIAVDKFYKNMKYVISGYEPYRTWHLNIQILDNENNWVNITYIHSSKRVMTFEQFVDQIVTPIIAESKYNKEWEDKVSKLDEDIMDGVSV